MEVRTSTEKCSIGFFFDHNCPIKAVHELRAIVPDGVIVTCAKEEDLYHEIPDTTLAGFCRGKNVIFITQDEKIPLKDYRAKAFHEVKIGYIEVRARNGTGEQKLRVYRNHYDRMLKLLEKPVPFYYVVTADRMVKGKLLRGDPSKVRSREFR